MDHLANELGNSARLAIRLDRALMGKAAVWGTWHLGSVHAACLAEMGNTVLATDLDPAVVAGALRLARIAPGELRPDAVRPEVHVDATQGLVVRSGAGWEIRFGTPDDLERKLANAKRVLSDAPTRRLDYVDVRSPDRIVFSPQ